MPSRRTPFERRMIDVTRQSVYPMWLRGRTGIGKRRTVVKAEGIVGARLFETQFGVPPAALSSTHRDAFICCHHRDALRGWRPHCPAIHSEVPSRESNATGN